MNEIVDLSKKCELKSSKAMLILILAIIMIIYSFFTYFTVHFYEVKLD